MVTIVAATDAVCRRRRKESATTRQRASPWSSGRSVKKVAQHLACKADRPLRRAMLETSAALPPKSIEQGTARSTLRKRDARLLGNDFSSESANVKLSRHRHERV